MEDMEDICRYIGNNDNKELTMMLKINQKNIFQIL